ncbi:hypothetical protein JO41_07365 [Treponema sp. OMZ 838]|uniref:hypothetical protein n=1 Tax=Treponema sp. OMZ 838 TaxID=1539298 RepID=UPI000530108B|nr:hypothetical protein [Treponema sp. OMZ 838]AIW89630.1 hypothetical protein JO41_07365 [Treponema sp. OMZ 838]
MSSYKLRMFFEFLSCMPGLYWILLWFLLLVYCGFSLLGRFNEKLKSIIFDSFDVDTGFHIFRYTIMPIFIFILLTVILLMRIISGTMDYGYGSPKLLIKVIVIVIVFVVLCYIAELQQSRYKAGKIDKLFYVRGIIAAVLPAFIIIPLVLW